MGTHVARLAHLFRVAARCAQGQQALACRLGEVSGKAVVIR
jgi:hypothetical protein